MAEIAPDIAAARLAMLPPRARWSLRGGEPVAAKAAAALGIAVPERIGRFGDGAAGRMCRLGPDEWFLVLDPEAAPAMRRMADELMGERHSLVDVGHRSEGIAVSGPKAAWVINHGCPLDLHPPAFPVGACTRTLIGKAEVILARPAAEDFHIDVWRSFAAYVRDLLDEARRELA